MQPIRSSSFGTRPFPSLYAYLGRIAVTPAWRPAGQSGLCTIARDGTLRVSLHVALRPHRPETPEFADR